MSGFLKTTVCLVLIALPLGGSISLISCKSVAGVHANSPGYGGKQPVTKSTKRGKTSPRTSSSSGHSQKVLPVSRKPEASQVGAVDNTEKKAKEADEEGFLMKEIPKVKEPGTDGKLVPGVGSLLPAANGPIKISKDNANRIIDAGGKDVIVAGNDCVIVIKGGSGKLSINGKNNQVQCDSVNQIEITGDGNTLILGALGGGVIRGDKNDLSWGRGIEGLSPIVESFGTGNSMKRLE